jgi:large subunit ribosomal protein L9
VFERVHPHYHVPPKHKLANTQQEIDAAVRKQTETKKIPRVLVYNPLEEDQPLAPVKVILLHNTEDHGSKGQIAVIDNPREARDSLLLPGLAVYATEENLKKYKDILIPEGNRTFSSSYIKKILPVLSRYVLPVTVNSESEWLLEARHIRACYMKLKINIPVDCIEMPKEEIRGPDMDLEHKEFLIHIKVRNR